VLLAAALRLAHVDAGWFGVDQARDVTWAQRIASGEAYPEVGPAMRNRFHLGTPYYYFWSLPSFLSPSPLAPYVHAGVLGSIAVVLTWCLTRAFAGPAAALAAAALLATSPVAVLDARIAWAPAALPFWSALLLLAMGWFAGKPSGLRAAALLFLAALGTQLHVAAAPLALLAGAVVVWHVRALSPGGLLLAAVAGALPLASMLLGASTPMPPASTPPALADPTQHRAQDLLLLVSRVVSGLSPAPLPAPARAWLPVETALSVATLLACGWVLLRPRAPGRDPRMRLVAVALLVGLAAVALLPAEAWYYYLDMVLVPAAAVLGVAWQALRWRRLATYLLAAIVVGRTALLAWWIAGASSAGFVSANLDFLRIGGPRPAAPEARARLLGVGTKAAAADVLVREAGIAPERLWRDAHGSAFADLDTDNGYFFRHAAAASRGDGASAAAGASEPARVSALVVYRGEFPDAWLARSGAARHVGPLEIRTYEPAIDLGAARLVGCGDGAPPEQRPRAPLDYGSGEPALPVWPCTDPTVAVPVRAVAADVALRVLARTEGAARVLEVTADPPGEPVASAAPGAGVGVALAPGSARLLVRLAVEGPARLDLYELRGLR
jgi:hypothetical protein